MMAGIPRNAAAQIRSGIVVARQVMRRERCAPKLSPFGFRDAPRPTLFESAYRHTLDVAVRQGRLRPPAGPSGISRAV